MHADVKVTLRLACKSVALVKQFWRAGQLKLTFYRDAVPPFAYQEIA